VWAWAAERRWSHHGGDPSFRYDVPALLAVLGQLDPGHVHVPGELLTRLHDRRDRPSPGLSR